MAIDGPHGTAMAIDELRWDLSTGRRMSLRGPPFDFFGAVRLFSQNVSKGAPYEFFYFLQLNV